ncbi:oligosaccharide flippase family protein [Blastococcus mobilis]|uniref:oligosaccharide flippase family protein n=1 Tax=Blastococcus mobilis TaxID=1938746 RepID=UPI001130B851|nr:oligosaccharide flippase family protein [Blastococcus mobilis]
MAVLARGGALPIGAVFTILTSRTIAEHYGATAFAFFALLTSFVGLLAFSDLGLGAAVANAAAEAEAREELRTAFLITIRRVFRYLLLSMSLILCAVCLISLSGAWGALLGEFKTFEGGALAAAWSLAIFGASIPLGMGQRILVGFHKTWMFSLVGALTPPLAFFGVTVIAATGGPPSVLPIAFYLAYALTSGLSLWLALRVSGATVRDISNAVSADSVKVWNTAAPMAVIVVAAPIAMQSDRVILGHLSPTGVAGYSLAAQLFSPIGSMISVAGLALWPVFARRRVSSISLRGESPLKASAFFSLVAAACAGVAIALTPVYAEFASAGAIEIPLVTAVAFGLLVVVQAFNAPIGTYLTDGPGLKAQAMMVSIGLIVKLAGSLTLAGLPGGAGPVLASTGAVLMCQVVPGWWLVRRREATEAAAVCR